MTDATPELDRAEARPDSDSVVARYEARVRGRRFDWFVDQVMAGLGLFFGIAVYPAAAAIPAIRGFLTIVLYVLFGVTAVLFGVILARALRPKPGDTHALRLDELLLVVGASTLLSGLALRLVALSEVPAFLIPPAITFVLLLLSFWGHAEARLWKREARWFRLWCIVAGWLGAAGLAGLVLAVLFGNLLAVLLLPLLVPPIALVQTRRARESARVQQLLERRRNRR